MAVAHQATGTLAANATTAALAITAPACAADDILIAHIVGKDNLDFAPPDGTWTPIVEVNNTANQRVSIFWKRATGSGGSFTFTKSADNNLLCIGVISAWRGCLTSASPIDGDSQSLNASSDTVTYATLDPAAACHVVAMGCYNNDLTTAGAIAGTDPAYTNRYDLESGTGTDASLFCYSGDSTGAATGARTHSTTSTADDVNIGIQFGLTPEPTTGTLTGTLPVPTMSASGSKVDTGTLAGSAPVPTASMTGLAAHQGPLAGTAPVPTMAASGTSSAAGVDGTLAGTIPLPTASMAGVALHHGALTATIPVILAAMSGIAAHIGTLSAQAPMPTASMSGVARHEGNLAAATPLPTAAFAGVARHEGALAGTLPMPSMAATGSAANGATGTLAGTLPMATMAATGEQSDPPPPPPARALSFERLSGGAAVHVTRYR